MGNRKKMGKTESHQETQKEQPNNSRLSVDGDTAIAPEEEENDSNTATIAIDAIAMATTIAARWKSDDSGGFNVDCPLNPTHNGNENNVKVPNVPIVLPSDVDDANISRTEFDVDLMSKSNSLLIEKHTDGVVAKTTEEKSECVEASIVCRNNPDLKSVNEDPELSIDNHALQHEQLLNMKQQNQQQHRNYQLHLHHPHTHPQQHPHPPKIYSGHQHQQVPQHPQLSQFLQTPNNTSSLTANNRPQHQHQQQQGLITLPAIPTPCYVQQQANSSTLQPLGVDFLQPVNHHQLFPIANPTHQVMGPIPPLHFPAISNSQHQHQHHQHNIIVPSSHNAPGIHQLNQTAPSILSPSFKNLDQQQNIMCQSLNQQHQQNIMQQIEWQIQLQKNHIRQQQQQQLHNLRQNLHHQQLLQLHNSGILYQHPLKHRQNKNNQTNAHQCNPQHQHQHQQQHQQQLQQQIHQHQLNNMLQMQNQIRPHNSKIDLLCSNLDNHANTISDVRANQKVQSLHQHLQQHPDDEEQHNIPSQILQQQVHSTEHKRQPKLDQPQQEEQQQQPQQQQTQQSSTVLIAQSQQSTNGINSTIASAAVATNTTNAPTSTTPTASTSNQGVNLYVKHLDADVDDSALKKMFSRFGEVVSAKVMMEGQMSRGFGFVCFARAEDAARATRDIRRKSDDLSSMKNLYVAPAQRKEERQAIFRERLRSFMEDTPSGTAGQDNDTKAFTKPPSAKERKLSTPPEGLSGQSMPTSSERSLEKANTHAKLISVGEGAGSSNTFQNKPKTTTMPSPKRIDDKNQCVRINHKENARKISPCNSFTFSLSQSRRPSRKQPPMKHIFDLDNFSLEKLNVPLLKTAGQSYLPVHKNVQYSSMFSQDITEESQAEPIPHWFFGTDEEESASYHDALGKELFGNKDQVGYFQPAVPMTDPSTEFAQWLSLGICPKSVSCINFPKELNQAPDKFVCESASPRVGENTKMAGVNGLVKDKYCEGMQIYTHSLDSWCENTNLWNCKLITKEDNRIMNEKEEEETEEKNGTLLEIREECTETLDDCNRLVKACISCCTDTDSCNSGDEDIDQEYKENNHSILDTKCERGDYFGSMQNGQNNNSTNDDDVSACLSPLTKWTKRRKRDLSSDERTTVVETKIYDMAQESEDSNQLAHFKIVVASTPNRYKIRVLDLPVVTAPSRSRKRKCTTAPLSVDVEGIALPKMKKVDGKCNNMIPFKKCKHACLANALGKEVTI